MSVLCLSTESVCTENGAPMVFCANASVQNAYLRKVWNSITLEWRLLKCMVFRICIMTDAKIENL